MSPAVVTITTSRLTPSRPGESQPFGVVQRTSLGSGFVFDDSGHVLTCNHVVAGYEEIAVELADGTRLAPGRVRLVGRDPVTDLAVLELGAAGLPMPAGFADSDELDVGQPVVAVGSPFGLEGTATAGIVSGTGRWRLAKRSGPDFQDFIQTDALINPGNSGGPLVDTLGRVVGVCSFTRTARDGPTGIGFATPINLALAIGRELVARGRVERGYAGMNTQPLTKGIRQALGLVIPGGVMVAAVGAGRPADKAGVRNGDVVFLLDGDTVPDVHWLQNRLAARRPGDTARLLLWRRGQELERAVVLAAWPGAGTAPAEAPPVRNWLGLVTRPVGKADRARTGLDSGVTVEAVEPAGPSDKAGLRAGDVIVEVNYAPVQDQAGFRAAATRMSDYPLPVLFRVFRGTTAFYVAVEP